jgi:hypothetical protein
MEIVLGARLGISGSSEVKRDGRRTLPRLIPGLGCPPRWELFSTFQIFMFLPKQPFFIGIDRRGS